MKSETPQAPGGQEVKPEVGDVAQVTQQPADVSQTPTEPAPPEKPNKSKAKKVVIGLILLIVLIILGYVGYLAYTYWNCSKITPKICETNKCNFSLTGFKSTTETKHDCCGNTKCEVGETSSDCNTDCPSCDDGSDCTSDSYDYDGGQCIHEQLFAPCHVRPITLSTAIPETDYQIKIELNSTNFDYSKAKENGEDLRFSDENGDPLSFWIEDWNKEGVSTVWVKITDSAAEKINMYYGHADASLAGEGSLVFDFFEDFDYQTESELTKIWGKHGSPTIQLSDGIVTIETSGIEEDEEHGGQYISRNVGADILLSNIVEMNLKRFPGAGYSNHMAVIGNASQTAGTANDTWALLRHNPSPDGGIVVFGSNYGGVAPPPVGSFNTIKIYHQDGVSTAYEPPDTKVAEYSWPKGGPSPGKDYVLLGGTAYHTGYGKASYDWLRVRKYASKEPSASVGDEETASESSSIKDLYTKQ